MTKVKASENGMIMRARFLLSTCTLLALAIGATAHAAPKSVESLLPAGGQRGQTVEVQASGEFPEWPVQTWCNRPGLEIKPLKDKGKIEVQVAAEAEPGIYYLRLYDNTGTTRPLPFIVGTLPERSETEPNNACAQANELDLPALVMNGSLDRGNDVDTFSVMLDEGQTLVADIESHVALQSPLDAVLQVLTAEGVVVGQNDDNFGRDPRLIFTAPASGRYFVRIFGFPATPNQSISLYGNRNAVYRLTVTTGPFIDAAMPLAVEQGQETEVTLLGWNLTPELEKQTLTASAETESLTLFHADAAHRVLLAARPHPSVVEAEPNDRQQPQTISLPVTISGCLSEDGDEDQFLFEAKKGQALRFRVAGRMIGYPLDPVLEVFNAEGKSIGRADDSGANRDGQLTVTIPADGQYSLRVVDLFRQGAPRYWYRVDAEPITPDFTLKAEALDFEVAPGKTLEIPITVERQAGFAEAIAVTVTGLPENVTAEAVTSEGKGDSAKKVVIKLTAKEGQFSGPIRIVGTSAGDAQLTRPAASTFGELEESMADLWLTVPPGSGS